MSLQWTLVAGLLYSELALTILLLIPWISNRFWNRALHWSFLRYITNLQIEGLYLYLSRSLEETAIYYFYVAVAILMLAFLDSIREMQKFAARDQMMKESGMKSLQMEMQQQMKLFRSQRNFYIVGFSLFLCLVIKRLLELVVSNDSLQVCRIIYQHSTKISSHMLL